MLKITKLPVGDLEANCFIVADDKMNAVIIDPGAEGHIILDEIAAQGVKPLAMLLTHAHFDHFGAAADIMKEYPIPLYVHSLDRAMVTSAEYSLAVHLGYGAQYRMPQEDLIRTFEDNETLKFSEELEFLVIHTPGHSPGSSCFRHGDILFSGDTLFRDGVGRVDFKGGNIHDMRASLARLGAIEGDCTVYCGHYGSTTLEHERTFGHYLTSPKR